MLCLNQGISIVLITELTQCLDSNKMPFCNLNPISKSINYTGPEEIRMFVVFYAIFRVSYNCKQCFSNRDVNAVHQSSDLFYIWFFGPYTLSLS